MNLALCSLSMADRRYDIAESYLQAVFNYPEKVAPWHFSGFLARMTMSLYVEDRVQLAHSREWAPLLAIQSPQYQIDFMTSYAIVCSTTKLMYAGSAPAWTSLTEELIQRSASLLGEQFKEDQIRKARVLQAQACLEIAGKQYEAAYENSSTALSYLQKASGWECAYKTELLVDLILSLVSLKRWSEAIELAYKAVHNEHSSLNDPLRLAKIHFLLANALAARGDWDIAFDSLERASTLYDSISATCHIGSRLIILHRMASIAYRLRLPAERAAIRSKIQFLQERVERKRNS